MDVRPPGRASDAAADSSAVPRDLGDRRLLLHGLFAAAALAPAAASGLIPG